MRKVLQKKDKAVSPIIATILLIAITVVLAATLYSVIQGYTSYLGSTTPTASVKLVASAPNPQEDYLIYISGVSPNGNISLSNVELIITNGTGNLSEINLGFALPPGQIATSSTTNWNVSVQIGNYLGENPVIKLESTVGPQSISYLEFIDTTTSGTIATYAPPTT